MTASFYKTVYQRKFNEMPRWKQLAIVEDSTRKDYANSKSTISNPPNKYVSESDNKSKKISKKKN